MENFFVDENFYIDLDSYLDDHDLNDLEEINALDNDWYEIITLSELEPIFQMDENYIIDRLMEGTDKWEERFPIEDGPTDRTSEQIKIAIKSSVNIENLNSLLPKLYYPTGNQERITKKDLLEYIK